MSRHRTPPRARLRLLLTVAACLGATAVAPAAAGATVAAVEGGVLTVTGGPGEANTVIVTDRLEGSLFVTDSRPVTAGPGCHAAPGRREALCPGVGVESVVLDGGDGPDELTTRVALPVTLLGGAGDDRVVVDGSYSFTTYVLWQLPVPTVLRGGPGNDSLRGFLTPDELFGDEGDDVLEGLGNRDTHSGGPGTDTVTFREMGTGVTADLDGERDDGQSNFRRELIQTDVENLQGSDGDDVLVGGPGHNVLDGRGGSDRLVADDGAADELICGDGVDRAQADPFDVASSCEQLVLGPMPSPPASATRPATAPADGTPSVRCSRTRARRHYRCRVDVGGPVAKATRIRLFRRGVIDAAGTVGRGESIVTLRSKRRPRPGRYELLVGRRHLTVRVR